MTAADHSGRSNRLGGLVTAATAATVLISAVVSIVAFGGPHQGVPNAVPVAWLFSSQAGELGRVNGGTARVDTRVELDGSAGHRVSVEQTDRYLILRDVDTGRMSALDLVTLQVSAYLATAPGEGVEVVMHERTAYVVDRVRGQVRQVDPLTLAPVGAVLELPPGLRGGGFDTDGRLWLAVPAQGTVVAVTPNATSAAPPSVSTEPVTGPGHDLAVSVLDHGIAVLDPAAGQLVTVRGDQVKRTVVPLSGPARLAPRTSGEQVALTVPAERKVYVVDGDGAVASFAVPGKGTELRAAVPWAGRFYVADDAAGVVYVLGAKGTLVGQVEVRGSGDIELRVRGNYLYINGVDGKSAQVVDRDNKVSQVDKYPDDVVGGDDVPAPVPSASPSTSSAPSASSAPPGSSAPASSAPPSSAPPSSAPPSSAPPSSAPPSSAPPRSSAPPPTNPPANSAPPATNAPPSHEVPPESESPTASEPPDVPIAVTAEAKPDGTVQVNWTAPGAPAAGYQLVAIPDNAASLMWRADGRQTSFTVPAGTLAYGVQATFTVAAIDAQGGSSTPSSPSEPVTPFTKPDAPLNLQVRAAPDAGGGVEVVWEAPPNNGRAIANYVVAYDGGSQNVAPGATRTRLTEVPAGTKLAVTVVAYNEAGAGDPAGPVTAETMASPTITITGQTADYTFVTVNFTVDDGGGTPRCGLAIAGRTEVVEANCDSQNLTYGGLAPGVQYTATVTVTNAVGRAEKTVTVATKELRGTVTCKSTDGYCNSSVGVYSQSKQDTATRAGRVNDGQTFRAYCQSAGTDGNLSADEELFAAQYNHNKRSKIWIKIDGERYIPWVWFNLDGSDDPNLLPGC